MREMPSLRNPPPGFPVRTYPSAKITDQVLVEWENVASGSYSAIEAGTPHPNQREFSGFKLGIQRQNPVDENFIQRIWVTDQTSPDAYNYAVKFSGESVTGPIFIHTYRESRETYAPRAKGMALGVLYKLVLDDNGSGYSNGAHPSVKFDDPTVAPTLVAVAHGIINADSTIAECVLDFCGEGYEQDVAFTVESPVSGIPASGIAYVQPISAVLVKEEANLYPEESEFYAQYFQVTRVYETLPGPFVESTRLDDDSIVVSINTRRNVAANISSGEDLFSGVWTKTTKKGDDSFVAEEIVETRIIPGNLVVSTEFERDGVKKTKSWQLVAVEDVVTTENLSPNLLIREYGEGVTAEVSRQIVETITVLFDSLLDLPTLTTSIPNVIPEIFLAQIPTHVEKHIVEGAPAEPALVLGEFEHSERALSPLYKEVSSTTLDGGSLPIVITGILETNDKKQVVTVTMTLELDSTTPTTPNEVRDVEFKKLGNGLALEIVRVVPDVFPQDSYAKSIENLIPAKMRAAVPISESTIDEVGSPSIDPTLLTGELSRTEGRLTEYTKRTRITSLGTLSLPVLIYEEETTEEYGGGLVLIEYALDTTGSLTVDQGTNVVSSNVTQLGNGYDIRTTKFVEFGIWPLLTEYDQDPETLALITTTYQVVDATAVSAPSIVTGTITRYKKIDKWRSLEIIETYSLPADYDEQRFMAHHFPSLWDWTLYNYSTACGPTGPIREGFSSMVQARVAISFTTSKDTITGLTLIPNTHHLVHDVISAVLNDTGTLTYVGTCSGPISLPASSPDYSTYVGSIQGTEQLITGESVLWRAGLYKNNRLYVTML